MEKGQVAIVPETINDQNSAGFIGIKAVLIPPGISAKTTTGSQKKQNI